MTGCILTSPSSGVELSRNIPTVMVSGHFDGFHSAHLDYLQQAARLGYVICLVSSDAQVVRKKGKVNIPERERRWVVATMLTGLGCPHTTAINRWDTDTKTIANALRQMKPDILLRGYDKTPADMPDDEWQVCQELGIEVRYAENRIGERHSSGLGR